MKLNVEIIISVLFGACGILLSVFFYFKGKKNKRLVYNLDTTILISENLNNYENLKILYNNESINSLSSTNIKIRNIGNDIIEPENFIPSTPIIIETSNEFLLQDVSKYKINCSHPKNRASLEAIDKSHLKVHFDFLNPKDEIQIIVLHTGEISITGELKQGHVKQYSNKKYDDAVTYQEQDNTYYSKYYIHIVYRMLSFLLFTATILTMVVTIMNMMNLSQ